MSGGVGGVTTGADGTLEAVASSPPTNMTKANTISKAEMALVDRRERVVAFIALSYN